MDPLFPLVPSQPPPFPTGDGSIPYRATFRSPWTYSGPRHHHLGLIASRLDTNRYRSSATREKQHVLCTRFTSRSPLYKPFSGIAVVGLYKRRCVPEKVRRSSSPSLLCALLLSTGLSSTLSSGHGDFRSSIVLECVIIFPLTLLFNNA